MKEDVKKNVQDRIMQIMAREGLKAGEFADSINVAQATISQILRGRNMPSTDILLRLHQRYPDISLDWLLTGEGRMSSLEQTDDLHPSLASSGAAIDENDYPLFAENAKNPSEGPAVSENRKDFASEKVQNAIKEVVRQEVIYKERPARKITEIRIFFDDCTYETFKS
ncbi:MAG: helix-turn-helix domain-containing protein [Bacteroides sp.]|nr:helix-turn-helix domain-containing protein [Bacteroides sp.]